MSARRRLRRCTATLYVLVYLGSVALLLTSVVRPRLYDSLAQAL
ncbi:hypothetical protein [Streptomyces yaizuensis]|uniref:Uncharacterized protein n=1 Tax=Streptomyces yaizuensis TaxID=2989713 RepID=A0ABQ5P9K1_9ACTN|nr:hypothetical protein [Streptomyces sp. YSPA8]GLF99247.1 hypothetical protein SYYSPA8_33140 [Streptomyces sp. YSPA8]